MRIRKDDVSRVLNINQSDLEECVPGLLFWEPLLQLSSFLLLSFSLSWLARSIRVQDQAQPPWTLLVPFPARITTTHTRILVQQSLSGSTDKNSRKKPKT